MKNEGVITVTEKLLNRDGADSVTNLCSATGLLRSIHRYRMIELEIKGYCY